MRSRVWRSAVITRAGQIRQHGRALLVVCCALGGAQAKAAAAQQQQELAAEAKDEVAEDLAQVPGEKRPANPPQEDKGVQASGAPRASEPADEKPTRPTRPSAPRKLEVLPGAMARGIGEVEGRAIWLGTLDRQFIFRFSGFVHLDMRFPFYLDADIDQPSVVHMARRARFAFEGTTFGNLDYRFMFDPAVDKYPLDAYFDWRYRPQLNFRLGKFKSPFGFERRARAFALAFNERGFPTLIAPNRDVGLFVHGQTLDGFFSYDVALLAGSADLESANMFRGLPDATGRLYFQPFRLTTALPLLREFGVGVSGTYGDERGSPDDRRLGAMTTTGRTVFFRYRNDLEADTVAFADGLRRRASVHGHWRYGRFNTLWEYIWSEQRTSLGGNGTPIANQAWQVYAGMALTDDEWTFFGVVPRRPFDPARGQWGALAIAARYHEMRVDPRAFPLFADPDIAAQAARSGSLSLQWVHTQNLGAQADVEAVFFQGGAPDGANHPPELSIALRIQAFY